MQSAGQSNEKLDFEVDDLPMDVFSLTSKGLTVESLTAGHGLPENGASRCSIDQGSCCSCS